MMWTDDLLAELRRYAADGLSASRIAAAMNAAHGLSLTRNSIISVTYRNKIKLTGGVNGYQQAAPIASSVSPAPAKPVIASPEPAPNLIEAVFDAPAIIERVNEDFPRHGRCKFPFGDPYDGTLRFCGAPVWEEESWCARHGLVVFVETETCRKKRRRREAAAREELRSMQ